jgi:hypothetical protein
MAVAPPATPATAITAVIRFRHTRPGNERK